MREVGVEVKLQLRHVAFVDEATAVSTAAKAAVLGKLPRIDTHAVAALRVDPHAGNLRRNPRLDLGGTLQRVTCGSRHRSVSVKSGGVPIG